MVIRGRNRVRWLGVSLGYAACLRRRRPKPIDPTPARNARSNKTIMLAVPGWSAFGVAHDFRS
jgi:hypothetical protein